jgi:hypothetical protein
MGTQSRNADAIQVGGEGQLAKERTERRSKSKDLLGEVEVWVRRQCATTLGQAWRTQPR